LIKQFDETFNKLSLEERISILKKIANQGDSIATKKWKLPGKHWN